MTYLIVIFTVTPGNVCSHIEDRDKFGREALNKFVSTRKIEKNVNTWDAQRKNNWSYFKDLGATIMTKVSGEMVTNKQERALLSRFLVVARSRADFVVKDAIGVFEFNVAPPSNFNPDGSMIKQSDKSQVVSSIVNIPVQEGSIIPGTESRLLSVLIINLCNVHS